MPPATEHTKAVCKGLGSVDSKVKTEVVTYSICIRNGELQDPSIDDLMP